MISNMIGPGFPRSFNFGYVVPPARFSSIVSSLTQRLLDRIVALAESLSHWLRGLTCMVFLDRVTSGPRWRSPEPVTLGDLLPNAGRAWGPIYEWPACSRDTPVSCKNVATMLQKCCRNVATMLQQCIRGYKDIAKMHPQPSIVAKILQKCIRCCKRPSIISHNIITYYLLKTFNDHDEQP